MRFEHIDSEGWELEGREFVDFDLVRKDFGRPESFEGLGSEN